jgi:hypothetical protein
MHLQQVHTDSKVIIVKHGYNIDVYIKLKSWSEVILIQWRIKITNNMQWSLINQDTLVS